MDRPHLIASDVDGTLLTPLEKLSERTVDVVHRVHAEEVPFVLVSGRPPRWIPPVADPASITGYAVCANGAVLYDVGSDQVISVHGLDPVLLHDVADGLRAALPGAHIAAERVGSSAHDRTVPQFVVEYDFRNPWGQGEGHAASRAEVLGRTAVKLLVSDQRMTSDEMAEAARTVLGEAFAITFSTNAGLIEVSARSVTKASGLAEVAELVGVSATNVIAFGDMPNDLPMLTWAGTSYAMADAHPSVVTCASHLAPGHEEDGVARVLAGVFGL